MPIISTTEFLSQKLDYIIVGGGTTGLALAVRLSEDPNILVGVIEAGEYAPDEVRINMPGQMGSLMADKTYDWCFFTTPQKHANDRTVLQARGKTLGGSSALNFLVLFRPTKEEVNVLEELGNEGWNWESLLECFKRSETLLPYKFTEEEEVKFALKPQPDLHGTNGPLLKSAHIYTTQLHSKYIDALTTMGIPRNPEPHGGDVVGSFTCFSSVDSRSSKRSYSASAYFEPNKDRKNLLVLTGAHTTKIVIQEGPHGLKMSAGIEFIKDGKSYTTQAPVRDVILSAGTFQTPQILELSGIGNKHILEKYGIDCKVHLPGVGENLQEHVYAPTVAETHSSYESMDALHKPEVLAQQLELYKEHKGLLAGFPSPCFGFAPLRSIAKGEAEVSEWKSTTLAQWAMELVNAGDASIRAGMKKRQEIQERWFDDTKQPHIELLHFPAHFPMAGVIPAAGKTHTSSVAILAHPCSRGTVHITSADPLVPPEINPNYLGNPADLEILARAVDFTLRMWETDSLRDAVKKMVHPAGLSDINNNAERMERIKQFVKEQVAPVNHPVGTAAMMKREEGGVVDAELRVYGTSNLRVADVSILPLELSVHIQAYAYAIAEKATDILRKAH